MSQLFLEVIYSVVRLLNHNFNFVLVVLVRYKQANLLLLSLNHNFLTVHDVDTLCRSSYFLTLEVVNLTSLVVSVDAFDAIGVRSLIEQGDVDYVALAVDLEAHGNLELEGSIDVVVRVGEELCEVFCYEYTI